MPPSDLENFVNGVAYQDKALIKRRIAGKKQPIWPQARIEKWMAEELYAIKKILSAKYKLTDMQIQEKIDFIQEVWEK